MTRIATLAAAATLLLGLPRARCSRGGRRRTERERRRGRRRSKKATRQRVDGGQGQQGAGGREVGQAEHHPLLRQQPDAGPLGAQGSPASLRPDDRSAQSQPQERACARARATVHPPPRDGPRRVRLDDRVVDWRPASAAAALGRLGAPHPEHAGPAVVKPLERLVAATVDGLGYLEVLRAPAVLVRWLRRVRPLGRDRAADREECAARGAAHAAREGEGGGGEASRENRRASGSRRRTPSSEISPEAQMQGKQREPSVSPPASIAEKPIVMLRSVVTNHLAAVIDRLDHEATLASTRSCHYACIVAGLGSMDYRRRIDQACMSGSVLSSSPCPKHPTSQSAAEQFGSPSVNNSVYIGESDTDSVYSDWDEDRGFMTVYHYWALREEAQGTVKERRRVWVDTPSRRPVLDLRCASGARALAAESWSLASRTASSPGRHRKRRRTLSATCGPRPRRRSLIRTSVHKQPVLRAVRKCENVLSASLVYALEEIKPFSPLHIELDTSKQGKTAFGLPARPRVTSSTRRTALGWSKRSTGKPSTQDCKENLSASMIIPTPSETLRINRPRPRGRPTPARVPVPAA
ncbi:hypothetical protein OH77DRAFT_1437719 [Trametes cingulata]|nr:hypothetical protein OH77DRAFT_1437719 [Trametes cingulata]